MLNKKGRNSSEVLLCFSQRPSQKRGGIADLISLSTATIVIAIILILFVIFAGLVKVFEKVENGEKIYNEGEVGVGDMNHYMASYECLNRAKVRVKKGDSINRALLLLECYEELIPNVQVLMGRHDE